MLILLEGNDLTGKSTLAKAIAERAGLGYKHLGPPGESNTVAHHTAFFKEWLDHPLGLVLDRGHWSGWVYADFHPDNALSLVETLAIERLFIALGGVTIYCHAEPENILSRWDRGEEFIDKSDVARINRQYEKLIKAGLRFDMDYQIGRSSWEFETKVRSAIAMAQYRSKK